jgi:hypothetical protein
MRNLLIAACNFNWDAISPAIFGLLFQSVLHPEERRRQGAHYTTESNILKVIEPLFSDELRAEVKQLTESDHHVRPRLLRLPHFACRPTHLRRQAAARWQDSNDLPLLPLLLGTMDCGAMSLKSVQSRPRRRNWTLLVLTAGEYLVSSRVADSRSAQGWCRGYRRCRLSNGHTESGCSSRLHSRD